MRRPIISLFIVALVVTGQLTAGAVAAAAEPSALVNALLTNPVQASELPVGATIEGAEVIDVHQSLLGGFINDLGATWLKLGLEVHVGPADFGPHILPQQFIFNEAVFPTATDAQQALFGPVAEMLPRVAPYFGGDNFAFDRIDQQIGLAEPALGQVAAQAGGSANDFNSPPSTATVMIVAQASNVLVLTYLGVQDFTHHQINPGPVAQFVAQLTVAAVHQVHRLSGSSPSGAQTTDQEAVFFGVGLGGSQEAFEATYPAPDSTDGATNFAVGTEYSISGYKSVFVFWHNGYSAHIVLNARSGWPEKKAADIANRFLPTDVQDSNKTSQLGNGSVVILGHSAALAKRFSAKTYKTYGVGGDQGDLRVVLIPNASGSEVGTIDIAIGVGDELSASSSTTMALTTTTGAAPTRRLTSRWWAGTWTVCSGVLLPPAC